jgi:hypothetical protein
VVGELAGFFFELHPLSRTLASHKADYIATWLATQIRPRQVLLRRRDNGFTSRKVAVKPCCFKDAAKGIT